MIQAASDIQIKPLALQDEERDILEPKERETFINWLQTKYVLQGGTSAIEGPWSLEYTPYFRPIAEWMDDTTTREIWVFACSQGGKTTFGTGYLGHVVETKPGPFLLIMPTKPDVQSRVESRIRPMFRANPDLLRHVRNERVTNIFIGKQTIMDHMDLHIGWPTTAAALADKPICYILADETGKYPPYVGEEADPISLMRKRQRWFKGRSKLLAMTTPVTKDDMSDENWHRGDCCEWWVPCQHCNKWHQLAWENVKIDRNKAKQWYAESQYARGKYCRYVCPNCGALWTESERWKSVSQGKFAPAASCLSGAGRLDKEVRPSNYRSCRIHALMLHPMVETISSLTVEFVAAQKAKDAGNIQPLKDFYNSQLARPWSETRAETEIEVLKRHVGDYEKAKVPAGVQMLTAGLDVQLDHVWMRVLGWGYLGEWWSIFEQRIETGPTDRVENLEKVLPFLAMRFEVFGDPGAPLRFIRLAAIDYNFNTEAVYAFCVKCAGMSPPLIPVAGDDTVYKQQWRVGAAAGGLLKRYDLNLLSFKDALYRGYFEAVSPGPGYGHLHKDTDYVVLEHLTSEEKKIHRVAGRIRWIRWVIKEGQSGRANHYWDCDVYARAAAEIAGLWTIPDPSRPVRQRKRIGKPVSKKAIRTKY